MFDLNKKHILCAMYDGGGAPSSGPLKSNLKKSDDTPEEENTMYQQKHRLQDEDHGFGDSVGVTPRRQTNRRTRVPAHPEGRAKSNKVVLQNGREVVLTPEKKPAGYNGEVPLMNDFKVSSNVSHLTGAEMSDLLTQVGAKIVILKRDCNYSDLSFLPEGVYTLDMSDVDVKHIAAYTNAPSTLHTINFGNSSRTLKFAKLTEILSLDIAVNMRVSHILMSNGQKLRLDLKVVEGVVTGFRGQLQFSGINNPEDKAEYEELLTLLSRFGIRDYTLRESTQPVGLNNLPASVEEVTVVDCPTLDINIQAGKNSALRKVGLENVQSVDAVETANTLDRLYIYGTHGFNVTDNLNAKEVELSYVKGLKIESLNDDVVQSISLRNAPEMPQFANETASYKTSLNVELEALTLDEFKAVLDSPLKVNVSMSHMSLGGGVTVKVNLKVEQGEVVGKVQDALTVSGVKTNAQLDELRNVYDFLGGVKILAVENSPVVRSISDVDFGQKGVLIVSCMNLIVDETIPGEMSNLHVISIKASGRIDHLNTSNLQNVERIEVVDTPVVVTPTLEACELVLAGKNLTIESAESFSKKVRKIHISRFRGIEPADADDYSPVDAPADVLAKMPSYVEHNLQASLADRALETAGQVAEGLKRVKWAELPGACKKAAQLALHKLSNGSVGNFLANKLKLPHYSRNAKGEIQIDIDPSTWETYSDQKKRLEGLEDKSKKSDD